MKKLLYVFLFLSVLLVVSNPVCAKIVTSNVDEDNFNYQSNYLFASTDLAANLTAANVATQQSVSSSADATNFYTVLKPGRVVGITVANNQALTAGAATFDVTINGTVTGVQAVLDIPTRTALGASGSTGTQFVYMRQNRADTNAAQGFKLSTAGFFHNPDNIYGRATPLVAGNRIGVKVTTTGALAPTTADYIITIYVLE